jgi:acyl-CoA synthetase (AMP-forming)/AMP-acid ligase II
MAAAPGSPELRAAETPDTLCLSDERGRTLTWHELNALADAYAATLHDAYGVEAGGRVAVLPEPCVELFAVLLALAKLGASSVLPLGTADISVTGVTEPVSPGALAAAADAPPRFTGGAPPPAAVSFTGGRTGTPRAVVRRLGPERAAAATRTLADAIERVGLGPGHAHLLAAPPERAGPLFWAQLALALGGRVHVAADTAPEDVLRSLEEREIDSAYLTPADLEALGALPDAVKESVDTTALDVVLSGDASLTEAARDAADDVLGLDVVRDVYATTETGPIAIDGEPLAGVEVQERAGELWIRSPLLADGYLADPEATAAAFRDGWFATGDAGGVDADGRVVLSG